MSNTGGKVQEVIGLFANRQEAEGAIDELYRLGYGDTEIGFLDREEEVWDESTSAVEEAAKGAAGGAVGGAAVGAGAGLLASAGVLLVPGIGPFLAAGTLAGTLAATATAAAGGAALGGVVGAVFGDSDETGTQYREGIDQGGVLVTVAVSEHQAAEAMEAMRLAGAQRVNFYRPEGGWGLETPGQV